MQGKSKIFVIGGALIMAALIAYAWEHYAQPEAPSIAFAPYGADYHSKPDFAQLEYQYPIPPEQLVRITPQYLATLTQEQVDQIYARLSAGPIPDGPFDGNLFFPKGSSGELRAAEIIGGMKGLLAQFQGKKLELLGRSLWKGKVFYRNEGVLRNRIEDTRLLRPLIQGDLNTIPKINVNGHDAWLLFPAKLYCGQSLLDGRRESVIIDYAFSDEIPGYRERPDFLAGRRGFKVRDEIRMVYPGFYLGRAYLDRVFVLNFTLYSKDIAAREQADFSTTGAAPEDCWTGTQARRVAATP